MTTKDDIQESINQRLTSLPTRLEGGTIQDIIGSVSYELASIIDTGIETVLNNAFVTTADEEHLTIKGEELGIRKKEATYACVKTIISEAEPNIKIQNDILAKTASGIIFRVLETSSTDENGCAEVEMICLSEGSVGNIKAGELTEFQEVYSGFENAKITNIESGYDGYDQENVENYRERILEYLREDACNSNIADYIRWAKSISGVKNVVVHDAHIAGAGNVNVYISSYETEIASEGLMKKVKEYIEKEQIINAKVSLYPLTPLKLNIDAKISLKENANISTVKYNFEKLLTAYLDEKPKQVSYLYISNLLFETDGVSDVCEYYLNGSDIAVLPEELEVPVVGEINLTVTEE